MSTKRRRRSPRARLRRSSLPQRSLHAPVEFDPLPQDRHLPLAAHARVLEFPAGAGRRARRKRVNDDPVQHGLDCGALTVHGPRFPRIPDPLRRRDITHDRGRPGEPVVFTPRLVIRPRCAAGYRASRPGQSSRRPDRGAHQPARPAHAGCRPAVRAARRGLVLAVAQRLLHARGFQRIQHRAGHVLLQQSALIAVRPQPYGPATHAY